MDAINIILHISKFNDWICFILGGSIGFLLERCVKVKTFHETNEIGKRRTVTRKVPNFFIIGVLLLIAVFSLALIIIPLYYTTVPNVIGLPYEEAAARLHSAGLSCSDNYGRYGDVVTSVSPTDEYIKSGSMIDLSLGRLLVSEQEGESQSGVDGESNVAYDTAMPDLYMIQEQAAEKYLRNAGFSNVQILPKYTDTTVAGYVLRTEPFAGDPVNFGDMITIYVSINEVE